MSPQNISNKCFQRLVQSLKSKSKTITTVEQCCGGTLASSILAQPGASKVYFGGTVAYNTGKSKPLLLNNEKLHSQLLSIPKATCFESYVTAKKDWTRMTSIALCQEMGVDYCIAEGGAAGPTFSFDDMTHGFAVISVAGKNAENGQVELLQQEIIHSTTNNREYNMRMFANRAADLATNIVLGGDNQHESKNDKDDDDDDTSMISFGLDRAVGLRTDKQALEELATKAKYIVLNDRRVLVEPPSKLALLDHDTVTSLLSGKNEIPPKTFLGLLTADQTPVFCIDVNDAEHLTANPGDLLQFVDTRTTAPLFSFLDNELALHATAYAQWQRRAQFCNMCGAKTEFIDGGTCCSCRSCHAKSWPRQDPSMICLVSSRDYQRVLLARSPRHPDKMYTVLAGFVEAGETFEAAVARETFEETGVLIDRDSVQYIGSQPWPFPQSCMVAFITTANCSQVLDIDTNELVEAHWFTKEQVEKAAQVQGATMQRAVAEKALKDDPSLELLIPPKGVIARTLLDEWLAQ